MPLVASELIDWLGDFCIGSVVSMTAVNISMLIVGRLIEGIGIGTANSVGYALMRDIYSGDKLTKQLSYVSVFVGMTPVIAPLFGGYLSEYIGWRACFAALGLIGFIILAGKYRLLPETLLQPNPRALPQCGTKKLLVFVEVPSIYWGCFGGIHGLLPVY